MLHALMTAQARHAAGSGREPVAASAYPLIDRAIDDLDPIPFGPLLIADFGAGDGTHSLEPISRALEGLRTRGAIRPVEVVHTDVPGNHFTALSRTLETSEDRYLLRHPWARALMAARPPYARAFNDASLHFGWTASSIHWLGDTPEPISEHFLAQLSGDDAARSAFAERAAGDWQAFLEARAAELTPRASVVVADLAVDRDSSIGAEGLFEAVHAALDDCVERKSLRQPELERIAVPAWFRSLDEIRAPFAGGFKAPGGERLELVELQSHVVADPLRPLLDAGSTDDYADAQVGMLRSSLGSSFAAALDENRSRAGRGRALSAIWKRVRERVAADSEASSPTYNLFTALIRRVS